MSKAPTKAEHTYNKRAGVAGMKYDGTIVLHLRKQTAEHEPGLIFCAPGDHNYAKLFAHIGGLMPGETTVVTGLTQN